MFPFYCHSSLFSGSHYPRFLPFSMNRERQDDHYCAPSDGMQSVSCCGSVFLEILVSALSPVFSGVSCDLSYDSLHSCLLQSSIHGFVVVSRIVNDLILKGVVKMLSCVG